MEHAELKKNSIASAFFLFLQTGYAGVIGLITNIILTIAVAPEVFGLYITVLSIVALLNYLSDLGLVGALIQKKEIEKEDVITTFTIQQLIIVTLIVVGFLLTGHVQALYHLPPAGVLLYKVVLIAFFLSSLKSVPSLLLERNVAFKKIAFVQMLEQTVFNITVSILVLLHFEIYAFIYAILLRSIIGLCAMYLLQPWKPQLGIHVRNLKHLLSFGIPFQASSFLALFKDDLIILYVGSIIGLTNIGYIGWAKKWAEMPLRLIMDTITRILFPVLSRLQDDREKFSRVLSKVIFLQSLVLVPILLFMMVAMPYAVEYIPKYSKWQTALPLFNLFVISSLITSFGIPFYHALNAHKESKLTFTFMLMCTILAWILVPLFSKFYGIWGFPIAHFVIACTYIMLIVFVQKKLRLHIPLYSIPILISAITSVYMTHTLLSFAPHVFVYSLSIIALGCILYICLLHYIFSINVIKELRGLTT